MPHSSMPAPAERLVIATGNAGKLREFQALLAGLPYELVAQSLLGVDAVEETGTSFAENAMLKAQNAARVTGAAALADDSGLEVAALGGAPGIISARYAGRDASDAANNAKLIAVLAGYPPAARAARYRCALAFVAGPQDTAPLTAEAVWEGSIVDSPRGACGFGYDPHFWLPELALTVAQLTPADKNRLGHRGRAMRLLRDRLGARASPLR